MVNDMAVVWWLITAVGLVFVQRLRAGVPADHAGLLHPHQQRDDLRNGSRCVATPLPRAPPFLADVCITSATSACEATACTGLAFGWKPSGVVQCGELWTLVLVRRRVWAFVGCPQRRPVRS